MDYWKLEHWNIGLVLGRVEGDVGMGDGCAMQREGAKGHGGGQVEGRVRAGTEWEQMEFR